MGLKSTFNSFIALLNGGTSQCAGQFALAQTTNSPCQNDATLYNFIDRHTVDNENVQRDKKKEKREFT
jgi:hypothetical protein